MRWVLLLLVALAGCLASPPDAQPEPVPGTPLAHLLLWPEPADLFVQLNHVEGLAPTEFALQRLQEELEVQTGKARITILPSVPMAGDPDGRWTTAEIRVRHEEVYSLAEPYRFVEGAAYLHVMFLNGIGEGPGGNFVGLRLNEGILAVFAEGGRVALSEPNSGIKVGDSVTDAPAHYEAAILIHELGHAFGLVGLETPQITPRAVEGGGCLCHARNEDSVMHPGIEQHNTERFLESGAWSNLYFDEDDLADLAAVRAAYRV